MDNLRNYDAIIIGAGQAGPPLAKRLTEAGMSVAIVERHLFGGTCVNTGCIPTKAMVASAYVAHLARRADEYGVRVGGSVTVDLKRVMARKHAIAERSRIGVEKMLRSLERCTVYQGHARFLSVHEIRVGDSTLRADRVFINVGGRASIPALPGLDGVPYLTNSSMMHLDVAPSHLAIVGGGYVGLEFAQMFRRFGSDVTVIEMAPRFVQPEDDDVSTAIHDILVREGIAVRLNACCVSVSRGDTGVSVQVDCAEGSPTIEASHLLLAVGRRPNTDDLGLDAAGVARDDQDYIVVDDQLQTSVPGIWALGECNGKGAFTHTAYDDFRIVAANHLEGATRRVSDRIPAYALFIDPPLGRAGLTETEARQRGHAVLVGTRAMSRVGRAFEKGETSGLMKIVVDANSREVLGAAVLGMGGDEVIHCVLDTMYAKAPYATLQRAMHIHPTVSEYVPSLLED